MTVITDPTIGFKYGWASGDDGWGDDMNTNLEWIILLLQRGVISQTTSAPPGSPSVGDAYIIGPSATGAWAGEEKNLAIWWQRPSQGSPAWFIIDMTTLPEGILVYVQDENLPMVWDGTSAWTGGVDMSYDTALEKLLANLDVISDALTTPPGSPSIGDAYIPAATATGDWTGHEGKLAIWWQGPGDTAAAWLIITPASGQRAYIINQTALYRYYSSAWSTV